jgi:aspartate racemase
MKIIGLVGGMTPESTKDYYRILMELSQERIEGELNNPKIIIYSINLAEFFEYMRSDRPDKAVDLLSEVIEKLRLAGADIGAMTANTPHIFFDEIVKRTSLPLLSIIEATFDKARETGCKRALLLGTAYTMVSDMFPKAFEKGGIEIVVPDEEERGFINRSIGKELSIGLVKPETKARYIEICKRYIREKGADSVILGCTEIPMVLKDGDLPVKLLNTTRIHAEAIFDMAMGK